MNLKALLFAAPLLVIGVAAVGQNTTTGTGDGQDSAGQLQSTDFGQNWPEGMGSTFFSDDTMQTLRGDEELRSAWQSMSEVDREMLRGDCARLNEQATADGTSAGTSSMSTTSTSSTGSDASETQTGSDSGSSDTEGSAMARASITSENMTRLCTLFELN